MSQVRETKDEQTKRMERGVRKLERAKFFSLGWKMAQSLIKAVAKIILGAIVWYTVGAFLPQVREALPHFFQIVDFIVHLFDRMCALLVKAFL